MFRIKTIGDKTMPIFHTSFTVAAPLQAVAAFHDDTRTLRKLNPPPIIVQLHRVDPLGEGSVSEFTLWMGPLPIRWRAVHSQVGPNGFTDTQERGPLAYWKHTHSFTAVDARTTRVNEHIDYEYAPGLKGVFSCLLFGKPGLTFLFAYRAWATRRAVEEKKR